MHDLQEQVLILYEKSVQQLRKHMNELKLSLHFSFSFLSVRMWKGGGVIDLIFHALGPQECGGLVVGLEKLNID